MAFDQLDYCLARAAEERGAAASAPSPALARTHEELAAMYERQAKKWELARAFELEMEEAD